MIWPTQDQVVAAHARALAVGGGAAGLRDHGLLESALHRPLATFDGVPMYVGPHEKIAALIEALIRNHPFVDGNKRTAMLVGLATAGINGLRTTATDEAIEEVAVTVAERRTDLAALTDWLRAITAQSPQ